MCCDRDSVRAQKSHRILQGIIEIVDTARKSKQQELVEDLVQIITVFSCKLQGKRAHQGKKMIRELAGDDSDDKVNPSTAVAEQQTED